jgi:soluble lytic murein transglycosylase-like protein
VQQQGTERKATDEQIIGAMMTGAPMTQVAEQLGISRVTLYRRIAKPKFKEAMRLAQEEQSAALKAAFMAAPRSALLTLLRELRDPAESLTPGEYRARMVRVTAAGRVLDATVGRAFSLRPADSAEELLESPRERLVAMIERASHDPVIDVASEEVEHVDGPGVELVRRYAEGGG